MDAYIIGTTSKAISSGGTINGNLTITGDLTVSGGGALAFDEILEGAQVIDITNSEAFLVRKNGDGGDVFTINTSTVGATLLGALTIGSDGAGHDVVFNSGTSGDNFTWDASEECLIITGTDAAQALKVADGDLVVVDKIYLYDNDGGEYLHGSSDGHLEINAGTTLDITAPTVDLNSATEFNIDTAAYDLNASGAVTIDSAGVSIDSSSASNLTTSSGALTITSAAAATWSTAAGNLTLDSAAGSLVLDGHTGAQVISSNSGEVDITSAANVDINATTTVTVDGTGVSIDGTDDSNLTVTGSNKDLAVSVAGGSTQTLTISSAGTGTNAIDINATAGGVDIDANGAISLDSAAGSIDMNVVDGQTVAIGLNGGVETLWKPHGTAGSELWSTINTAGTTDGSDAAGSILLSAVAGGIGLAWADDKDLWAEGGRAVITANEDAADAIKLHADAGTSQTITIVNDAGTGAAAIGLTASAGGVTVGLGGGAGDDFIVDTTTLVVESDNNRVGIGTASPAQLLHVKSTSTDSRVKVESSASSGNVYLEGVSGSGADMYVTNTTARNLYLGTSGAASTHMVINASGKVGIGTTAIPHGGVGYAKFAIEGTYNNAAGPHVQYTVSSDDYPVFQQLNWGHDNVHMFFDSYYDGAFKSSDAGSNFSISKESDVLQIKYDSGISAGSALTWNSGLTLNTSGNVGIGTDSPSTPIHAVKDADNTVADILRITNTNNPSSGETGQKARMVFGLMASNDNGSNYYDINAGRITVGKDTDFFSAGWGDADSYMSFETTLSGNETEAMRITSDGNIGIGTDSPSTNLHLSSASAGLPVILIENTRNDANGGELQLYNNRGAGNASDDDQAGQITFYALDDADNKELYGWLRGEAADVSSGSEDGAISFTNKVAGSYVEAVRIVGGNVGIGTAAPSTIAGNAWTDIDLQIKGAFGATIAIVGDTQAALILSDEDASSNEKVWSLMSIGGVLRIDQFNDNESLKGTRLKLDDNSRISLSNNDSGTDNTVFGFLAGASLASGSNDNVFIGDYAGTAMTTGDYNVAIGSGAFDAAAGSHASNGELSNIAIGYNSMGAVNAGSHSGARAYGNIAIGQEALLGGSFGSSDLNLDYNIAIGVDALNSTGSAAHNSTIAIGTSAGTAINHADSSGSVLIGHYAGAALTEGIGNVAIGAEALDAEDDGDYNVAVGYQALTAQTGTSGTVGNTAVGYQSGAAITSGTKNVAIGKGALSTSTTALKVIAIGDSAMGACATGNTHEGTIAIGVDSQQNLTTGGGNIAIGVDSLKQNTTGARNVVVGSYAFDQSSGSGAVDSSDNVAIGNSCMGGDFADAASNNNVAVGASALSGTLNAATYNVAVGNVALSGLTEGDHNVAVGTHAGDLITTGGENICIGATADPSANNATAQIAIGSGVSCVGNTTITVGYGANTASLGLDGSDTTWAAASSDERYKENIESSSAGLSFIEDLRPVTYNWKKAKDVQEELPAYKEGSEKPVLGYEYGETLHGFIAQEVKEAIDKHSDIKEGFKMWKLKDDGIQTVADGNLMPIMVKAIQELSAKVEELEAKLK